MIDNYPVYNYLHGGTFWETLPIDINDVEKIEVVRGPAGALYGPNAINGVINIITRKLTKNGVYAVANSQAGSNNTLITNGSVGYKADKWSAIFSGNYQHRDRSQTSYYEYWRNQELEASSFMLDLSGDTISNSPAWYPHHSLAMKKSAGNVFVNYEPLKNVQLDLKAGLQQSTVQKVSIETGISPFSTSSSNTHYFDLTARIRGFRAQVSQNSGIQDIGYQTGNHYDYRSFHANVEYYWTRKNLIIRPGLGYRKAVYDDTRYTDTANFKGIFNAKRSLSSHSAFLRAEYKLLNNRLRIVSGLDATKFDVPDTVYASYEFATTYKPSDSHIFRLVYSMTPRSSYLFDTYVNQQLDNIPIGDQKYLSIRITGNDNLKLFTAKMLEAGYRAMFGKAWNFDVELFDVSAKNENVQLFTVPSYKIIGTDTIMAMPLVASNFPMRIQQQGITFSLNHTSNVLQVKTYATIQRTRLKDYAELDNSILPGQPIDLNKGKGTVTKQKATPALFGGAVINYFLQPKVNLNLAAYYTAPFEYGHMTKTIFNDGVRGFDRLNSKLLLNLTISYEATKGLHLFCSGKNLLNETSREFYHTDKVPLRFMAGFNYEFKK